MVGVCQRRTRRRQANIPLVMPNGEHHRMRNASVDIRARASGDLGPIHAVQTAQELQVVPGAVLGLPLDFTEQLRPERQRLAL